MKSGSLGKGTSAFLKKMIAPKSLKTVAYISKLKLRVEAGTITIDGAWKVLNSREGTWIDKKVLAKSQFSKLRTEFCQCCPSRSIHVRGIQKQYPGYTETTKEVLSRIMTKKEAKAALNHVPYIPTDKEVDKLLKSTGELMPCCPQCGGNVIKENEYFRVEFIKQNDKPLRCWSLLIKGKVKYCTFLFDKPVEKIYYPCFRTSDVELAKIKAKKYLIIQNEKALCEKLYKKYEDKIARIQLLTYLDSLIKYLPTTNIITLCPKCADKKKEKEFNNRYVMCDFCGNKHHSREYEMCFDCKKAIELIKQTNK